MRRQLPGRERFFPECVRLDFSDEGDAKNQGKEKEPACFSLCWVIWPYKAARKGELTLRMGERVVAECWVHREFVQVRTPDGRRGVVPACHLCAQEKVSLPALTKPVQRECPLLAAARFKPETVQPEPKLSAMQRARAWLVARLSCSASLSPVVAL